MQMWERAGLLVHAEGAQLGPAVMQLERVAQAAAAAKSPTVEFTMPLEPVSVDDIAETTPPPIGEVSVPLRAVTRPRVERQPAKVVVTVPIDLRAMIAAIDRVTDEVVALRLDLESRTLSARWRRLLARVRAWWKEYTT